MEFTAGQIAALLANKETVIVGFALLFLGWALLERKDRKEAESKLLAAKSENIETYKIVTAVVQKFDDNTMFWRDTIVRLTEKSLK